MIEEEIANPSMEELKSAAFKGGRNLFIRHILGFGINFSGSLILARFLGPEIIGLYTISYTLIIVFRGIIDFGTRVHLIRLPGDPSISEIQTIFCFQQCLGILCSLVLMGVVAPLSVHWYNRNELFSLVLSTGIGVYFYSWQNVPLAMIERKMEYRKVGIIEIGEIFVFNAAVVLGVFLNRGILGLVVGNILRGLLPAILALSLWKYHFLVVLSSGFKVKMKEIFSLVRTVFPIFGSDCVVWLILLAPPIIVGSVLGVKELGLAQQAYTVLGYTLVIAYIFQRVGLATFSKLQKNTEYFDRAVQKVLRLVSLIYIPLVMVLASLSPWWIPIVYGQKWEGMEKIMLIAALPMTATALFLIFSSALLAKGKASLVFKQNLVHGLVYWIFMVMVVRYLGARSVPAAHCAAIAASSGILIYGYNKYCGKFKYRNFFLPFLMGSVILGLSWFFANRGDILLALSSWGAFLVFWVLGHKKELVSLPQMMRKNAW